MKNAEQKQPEAGATDRAMPSSVSAERAVIGSVLIAGNVAWFRVSALVGAGDFYRESHRLIWRSIAEIAGRGDAIDLLVVKDEMQQSGQLDRAGGSAFVSSLIDEIPDIANVERYAAIVAREARRRRLIAAGHALVRRAMAGEDEPESIAADALAALTPHAVSEKARAERMHQVISDAYRDAESRLVTSTPPALLSGFQNLDAFRVFRRTFGVIGAPSSHGKSGWLRAIGAGFAQHGHGVLHATLESTPRELAWRHVSAESGIPHSRVGDFRLLADGDMDRLVDVQTSAKGVPHWLTRGCRTIDEIYAETRRMRAMEGIDVLLIDYFQLVTYPGGPRDREERLAATAQRLLEMALELEILVIAASQLNEDRKERAGGRLHQGDLKYAKALGESARFVLLFQRPHSDDKANDELRPCEVRFQVEKQAEGTTGDYEAHFDEITQRFGDGGCEENNCRRLRRDGAVMAAPRSGSFWND